MAGLTPDVGSEYCELPGYLDQLTTAASFVFVPFHMK